jgi:hypothetical protein
VVMFNTQTRVITIDLPTADLPCLGRIFKGVWNGKRSEVHQGMLRGLTIPARDAAIFLSEDGGSSPMPNGLDS